MLSLYQALCQALFKHYWASLQPSIGQGLFCPSLQIRKLPFRGLMRLAHSYMLLFLKMILLARTAKKKKATQNQSRKFIASSNRKAWEDTSIGHNVVEDHEIGRAMALFSAVVLSSGFTLPRWCQDGCGQLPAYVVPSHPGGRCDSPGHYWNKAFNTNCAFWGAPQEPPQGGDGLMLRMGTASTTQQSCWGWWETCSRRLD